MFEMAIYELEAKRNGIQMTACISDFFSKQLFSLTHSLSHKSLTSRKKVLRVSIAIFF